MKRGRNATAWILLLVLAFPLVMFFFLYYFTEQNFDSVPFQYDLVENGDTVYHRMPDGILFTDLEGNQFLSEDLAGNLVFVDFFTVREDSQKLTTVLHGNLERTYRNVLWERDPAIRFLSVSTGDDPEELRAHAEALGAVSPGWRMVTVSQEDLYRMGEAFQIPAFGRRKAGDPAFTSQTVTYLDKSGRVRNYYTGTDLQEERKIQEDIVTLFRLEYPDDLAAMREDKGGFFKALQGK
ncbi:MAG: hypothetical protein GFH27_549397n21 [Chloroflexi bacterium AL-W]|nr:hypothetical protein [Chloroflexi bacterium AL-W]